MICENNSKVTNILSQNWKRDKNWKTSCILANIFTLYGKQIL